MYFDLSYRFLPTVSTHMVILAEHASLQLHLYLWLPHHGGRGGLCP